MGWRPGSAIGGEGAPLVAEFCIAEFAAALGLLCRRHHRVKTHGRWRYLTLEPGVYLWTSPHGYQFLREPRGTTDTTPDHRHREAIALVPDTRCLQPADP